VPDAAAAEDRLTTGVVLMFAVSCGLAVANMYYSQPLLHSLAHDLHTGSATAGLVVTLSQVGYALGLALVVPVGDIVPRRQLVPLLLLVAAAALAGSAAAGSIGLLIALALPIGLGSVSAQVLIPFAALLAGPERRGRVVGTVMSGLLIGILLARTLSGLVASATSWRVVYVAAGGAMLVLAGVLARVLPAETRRPRLPYAQLLASTVRVFKDDAVLRRRAGFGALAMGAFSIFWTTVAFVLAGPPYHYGEGVIGLFGLIGAAGALTATFAGRAADRGRTGLMTWGFAACAALSWLPLWLGRHHLTALVAGIVLLDIGVQGTQVTNQSVMYSAGGEDRSRANAAYMVCYFTGGAAGSAAAAALYSSSGWTAVCLLGLAVGVIGVTAALLDLRRPAIRRPPGLPAVGSRLA
jgi:predicted MFS family arabinose efflux permease